jgi:uncharacterized protein (TIGR02246 family)
MRRVWIISAIAVISPTVSAYPQPADQSVRQQIERLAATYEEHFDKQDAAGLAGLYARDGVLVSQAAKVVKTGPQEIEQNYRDLFKSGVNHAAITVDQVSPLGADAVIWSGTKRPHQGGQPLVCGRCARRRHMETAARNCSSKPASCIDCEVDSKA